MSGVRHGSIANLCRAVAVVAGLGALASPICAAAQASPTVPPSGSPPTGARSAPPLQGAPGAEAAQTGGQADTSGAANTAASSSAPVTTPPSVSIQTGAPQPPSQNLASPLPATPPTAAPSPAVVKVGGGMILLYSNNYKPEYDANTGSKKHVVDVWRASIVLDAKLDRYGMHIEFRARDRGLRWMPVNSWLEELYASVDLIKPGSAAGPLVLKVGKSYMQFGRFWDNSFYGNIHLRDGLKLIPNWGLSFEGTLGAGKQWGARYFAQYYVIDGQTSTANTNRDTNSIVAPGTTNQPIGARRRDEFIVRLEPGWTMGPTMNVRIGGSFATFITDYPDTFSPAATARMSRIRDLDNTNRVYRYGADIAGQLKWFGFWAEYTKQDGSHTNAFPYAPVGATMAAPPRPGSGSDDITYLLAGANLTYDRYTIQYNYNQAEYKNIKVPNANAMAPVRTTTHKEWIHNPSVQVKINDQLRFILEFPIWRRNPALGLPPIDPAKPANARVKEEVVEQQILATLHGKF